MKIFAKSPSRCFFLVDPDDNFLQTPSKKESHFSFTFFHYNTNSYDDFFLAWLLQRKKIQRRTPKGKKAVL